MCICDPVWLLVVVKDLDKDRTDLFPVKPFDLALDYVFGEFGS
jgi:hypothetical protein